MSAVIDHEGVAWTYGRREAAAFVSAGVAAVGFAATFALFAVAPPFAVIAALPGLLGAYVAVQALRSHTARVTTRAITLTSRTALGRTVATAIRLDDIVHAAAARSKHGDWAVVVRTRSACTVIGSGEPEDDAAWMAAAVHQAIHRSAERERVEGREWGFLRNAPETLTAIASLPDNPDRKG